MDRERQSQARAVSISPSIMVEAAVAGQAHHHLAGAAIATPMAPGSP